MNDAQRLAYMLADQRRHLARIADENTQLAESRVERECKVHSIDANATQAAKRHRARFRDAQKRHEIARQIERARYESHDVVASTFSVASTLRAVSETRDDDVVRETISDDQRAAYRDAIERVRESRSRDRRNRDLLRTCCAQRAYYSVDDKHARHSVTCEHYSA